MCRCVVVFHCYFNWHFSNDTCWYEGLTPLKRPWCWETLRAGGEEDDRGWDGWMASLTRWTWVWVDSKSWWWTGRSGMLRFMGSQRVGHDWATELNWMIYIWSISLAYFLIRFFFFSFENSLYVLNSSPLSYTSLQMFFAACGCLFILLTVGFICYYYFFKNFQYL